MPHHQIPTESLALFITSYKQAMVLLMLGRNMMPPDMPGRDF